MNPEVRCEPSQYGLFFEWPQRQSAAPAFPSIRTRFGPFSLETISTFGMASDETGERRISPR